MKKYYLAYGSNLNLGQMAIRCKRAKKIGKTILKDYRLAYKGYLDKNAYLTVEPCKGSYVPLGIFEISILDELILNKYEGFPKFYYKEYLNIKINGKVEKAMIYIMNQECDYNMPNDEYVTICKQGYDDFSFDKELLEDALNLSKNKRNKKVKSKF